MVTAVGAGAPNAAMFHLFTHAFFKALLFLGAGAVIHALHHEQNIWRMGGLGKHMPKTYWTFVIGSLALMGCPPLAGFFSKEYILLAAYTTSTPIFIAGLCTAFLTAFYMTRLIAVAFLGSPRTHEAEHGHDGPPAMTAPLLILAVLSVVAGWPFVAGPIFGSPFMEKLEGAESGWLVTILATLAFCAGAASGYLLYAGRAKEPIPIGLLKNKFYFDEIYACLVGGTQDLLAKALRFFDKWLIDGLLVRGGSGCVWGLGFVLRFFQVGNIQGYAFLFGLGVIGLIYYVVFAAQIPH
jgi:NADH-quinone oxidoreductase subunit L